MQLMIDDKIRYARHFPVIGEAGQAQLQQARVLCIGAGGLGCPVLQYLASAGIGTIGIIDGDTIELSNLQRQILFTEQDIGQSKAQVAAKRLKQLNSSITIKPYAHLLTNDNAASIIKQYDIIVDGSDNATTRYLSNQVCRAQQIPLVSAAVNGKKLQLGVFNYQQGPCYECVFPTTSKQQTPNCNQTGVLGATTGIAGTLQALEVIKIILQQGTILNNTLLTMDVFTLQATQYTTQKHPNCHAHHCGYHYTMPSNSIATAHTIEPTALKTLLDHSDKILLIDVRNADEHATSHIPNSILIPLHELATQIDDLPTDYTIVTYCKMGIRSAQAAAFLVEQQFKNVYSLAGGILNWQKNSV